MKKIILYISVLSTIVISIFYFIDKSNIKIKDEIIIDYFNIDYLNLTKSNRHTLNEYINLNNLLNYEFKSYNSNEKNTIKENKIISKKEEEVIKEVKPIVYIYNTHNKEEYVKDSSAHSIVPNVVTVSYILKEELEKRGILSIVEERKVSDVLNKNKWNYASSYKASREFLTTSKNSNLSLEYFIDVHRDSVSKSISTISIKGTTYAKVMFVLGLENKNYKENLIMMEYINNRINSEYPGLSRGIYKKKGKGVNGIYNQDFSKNCILIEFGGNENKIEEVYNSALVIVKYLVDYIGDTNGNK